MKQTEVSTTNLEKPADSKHTFQSL